jgi:hypothetical protein
MGQHSIPAMGDLLLWTKSDRVALHGKRNKRWPPKDRRWCGELRALKAVLYRSALTLPNRAGQLLGREPRNDREALGLLEPVVERPVGDRSRFLEFPLVGMGLREIGVGT